MLVVFDFARKVARHYTNVLLTGLTGAYLKDVGYDQTLIGRSKAAGQ